ncbi:hypothetical protein [Candidatus Bartonella washoeensis]|nr:hypothetical protein [Bartonella washoeensis]
MDCENHAGMDALQALYFLFMLRNWNDMTQTLQLVKGGENT